MAESIDCLLNIHSLLSCWQTLSWCGNIARWIFTFQPPLEQELGICCCSGQLVCRWMPPGSFWVMFHFPVQREYNLVCVRHNPFPSFSYLNMNLPLGIKATICDGSSNTEKFQENWQKCQPKCHQFTKSAPAGTYILVSCFFLLLCWVFAVAGGLSLAVES